MNNIKRKKKKRTDWTKRGNLKQIHLVADSESRYGFVISGQQPSIIKSIVRNSPASLAGLRSGDFLISVNGQNVYDKSHDEIVALISESSTQLTITISDNFLSESSDEDFGVHHSQQQQLRSKNKFKSSPGYRAGDVRKSVESIAENLTPASAAAAMGSSQFASYANQSELATNYGASTSLSMATELINHEKVSFRVICGYLGTIDGVKNEQTTPINCCIRKLRQEKRNPLLVCIDFYNVIIGRFIISAATVLFYLFLPLFFFAIIQVLMNIVPWSLNLLNNDGVILATYSSDRIVYCCSSTDNERKYFGLVTSNSFGAGQQQQHPQPSSTNSCHVFFIDPKLRDHEIHSCVADTFNFTCSKDIVSNSCLEFQNSDYICKLINGMYNIKCDKFYANVLPKDQNCLRNNNITCRRSANSSRQHDSTLMSPGDTTTASSNSDSGIGQYDCTNISDRILVVDFQGIHQRRSSFTERPRPLGIVNDLQLQSSTMMRNLKSLNISTTQPANGRRDSFYLCKCALKSSNYTCIFSDFH